jgi:hypothetical protein
MDVGERASVNTGSAFELSYMLAVCSLTLQLLAKLPVTCPTTDMASLPIMKYQAALRGNIEDSIAAKQYPNFCSDWQASVAAGPCLKAAQQDKRDQKYYNPSQAIADGLGLRYALSRAVLYDTYVQHGTSGVQGILGAVKLELQSKHTDQQEEQWLSEILDARYAELMRPRDDNGTWAASASRPLALKGLLESGQMSLASLLKVVWNGNGYNIQSGVRMPPRATNCAMS